LWGVVRRGKEWGNRWSVWIDLNSMWIFLECEDVGRGSVEKMKSRSIGKIQLGGE